MKKIAIMLSVWFALLCGWNPSFAYEKVLSSVPWHSQLDVENGMGTNWSSTMNCGPTALSMLAGYLRGFTPTTGKIKDIDDWLYANSLITAINNYNLAKPEGTGYNDLRAAASYLFGLWNSEYMSVAELSKELQVEEIHNSLYNNYPVIIGVNTYMSTTGVPHWMVAVGLRDVNNDGIYDDILVNDPGRGDIVNGVKWYSISSFKSVLFGSIFFYPDYNVGEYNDAYSWHNDPWYDNTIPSLGWDKPSQPFVDAYLNNGGPDSFGYPTNKVYQIDAPSGVPMYAQDFIKNGHTFTLFLNRHVYNLNKGYLGLVFPVHGQIKNYWLMFYQLYGPPASNEYYECAGYSVTDPLTQCPASNLYVVQWFEPHDNQYEKITYNPHTGKYNDLQSLSFEYGDHLNQSNLISSGYKSDGYGMGGGGGSLPILVNDYNYTSSYVCDGWTYGSTDPGSPDYWNLQPDTARTSFGVGEDAYCLAKVQDIMVDHEWKVELYKDGSYLSAQQSGWRDVGEWGWGNSDYTPYVTVGYAGNYEYRVSLDTGSGFDLIETLPFTVTGTLPVFFLSNSWTATGFEAGPNPNQLVPVGAATTFTQTDTVYDLVELTDVRVDHQLKAEVWKDGVYSWETSSAWLYTGGYTWAYSYFNPAQGAATPGNYEFRIFLDTGSGFNLIKTDAFTITSSPVETIPWQEFFNDDNHGFTLEDHSGGLASMSRDNCGLGGDGCLVVSGPGNRANWEVQVKKIGFAISVGNTYTSQIAVKADQPGTIYVAIQREVSPWDNFGYWQEIPVTTAWTYPTLQFTVSGSNIIPEEVRFTIMTGEITGNLYIDEVQIMP